MSKTFHVGPDGRFTCFVCDPRIHPTGGFNRSAYFKHKQECIDLAVLAAAAQNRALAAPVYEEVVVGAAGDEEEEEEEEDGAEMAVERDHITPLKVQQPPLSVPSSTGTGTGENAGVWQQRRNADPALHGPIGVQSVFAAAKETLNNAWLLLGYSPAPASQVSEGPSDSGRNLTLTVKPWQP
jgi:hypothetical protein